MGNSIPIQMNTSCNVEKLSITKLPAKNRTHPCSNELLTLLWGVKVECVQTQSGLLG